MVMGDGVVVPVEADVGGLARPDGHGVLGRETVFGRGQLAGALLLEALADDLDRAAGMMASGTRVEPPAGSSADLDETA
jgi:hypothetical protein